MTNAVSQTGRFLDAFNRIEQALQVRAKDGSRAAFHALVIDSKALTEQQKRRLRDVGDLRNAIVHHPGGWGGVPIAEPRSDVVEWLEQQAAVLENPPRVSAVLKTPKPLVLEASDDLSRFLAEVRAHDYSQSPVRLATGGLALVTTNAVARWVASGYEVGSGVVLEDVSISEILRYSEEGDRVVIRPVTLTAVEAARIFAGGPGVIPPMAIVLTNSGSDNETPLKLCVRADVAELLRTLGV